MLLVAECVLTCVEGFDGDNVVAAEVARPRKPAPVSGTKIMILNLDPEISEEELKELFESAIGPVASVSISSNAAGTQVRPHLSRQKFLGCAIRFMCPCTCRPTARLCIEAMNTP